MRSACLACLLLLEAASGTHAETARFFFGGEQAGVGGLASATLLDNGVSLTIEAAPTGAVLNEASNGGLGVNSRGIAGATDGSNDKFDVLGGSLAGQSDAIAFSFDTAGVITELNLDGVKDESFEFFTLTTPTGEVYSIFDSQIGLRLNDIASIGAPNLTLLSETGGADDDLLGIAIPFTAGGVFTLVYGEHTPDAADLVPGFTPLVGNGARLQGLVIETVPEPASAALVATLSLLAAGRAGRSSRK